MDSSDPRFTLEAWHRFEGVIEAWLAAYPAPYIFKPDNLSVETVMARLRDAVKAKLTFGYPSSVVDHQILTQRWADVVVTRARGLNGHVRIGRPEGRVKLALVTEGKSTTTLSLVAPTLEVLNAACVLLNAGVIATEISVTDCPAPLYDWLNRAGLPAYPNVAVASSSDNGTNFTLI